MFFWNNKSKPQFSNKFDSKARIKFANDIRKNLSTEPDPFKLLETALTSHIIGKGSRAENARNSFSGKYKSANINRLNELSFDIWLVQKAFSAKLLAHHHFRTSEIISKAIETSFGIIGGKYEISTSEKQLILDTSTRYLQVEIQDPHVLAKFIANEIFGIQNSRDFGLESIILNEYLSTLKALSESVDGLLKIISASIDSKNEKGKTENSEQTNSNRPERRLSFTNDFDSDGRAKIYADISHDMESARIPVTMLNLSLAAFVIHNESRAEIARDRFPESLKASKIDRAHELSFDFWVLYVAAESKLAKYPQLYPSPESLIEAFCFALDAISRRYGMDDVEKENILKLFVQLTSLDLNSVEKWVAQIALNVFDIAGPDHISTAPAIVHVYFTSIKGISETIDDLCQSIIHDAEI